MFILNFQMVGKIVCILLGLIVGWCVPSPFWIFTGRVNSTECVNMTTTKYVNNMEYVNHTKYINNTGCVYINNTEYITKYVYINNTEYVYINNTEHVDNSTEMWCGAKYPKGFNCSTHCIADAPGRCYGARGCSTTGTPTCNPGTLLRGLCRYRCDVNLSCFWYQSNERCTDRTHCEDVFSVRGCPSYSFRGWDG